MEAALFQIIGEQIEIIKECDLNDPVVQDELISLTDRFKVVIEEGD